MLKSFKTLCFSARRTILIYNHTFWHEKWPRSAGNYVWGLSFGRVLDSYVMFWACAIGWAPNLLKSSKNFGAARCFTHYHKHCYGVDL